MNLEEQINNDIKQAMLAKDKDKLEALRGIKSAILLLKTDKSAAESIKPETEISLLQKLIKQRKESADIYIKQARQDLADVELKQISFIEPYLPKQLPIEQVEAVVRRIITETAAASVKDMGKVMAAASKELAGKIDNATIGAIAKKLLVN